MMLLRIKKRRKRTDIRLQILENAAHKLFVLEKELKDACPEDSAIQLFHITKKMISALFSVPYNFSQKELSEAVYNRHFSDELASSVLSFASAVSITEFSGIIPSQQKIRALSRQLKKIILAMRQFIENQQTDIKKGKKMSLSKIAVKLGLPERKGSHTEILERIYDFILIAHKKLESQRVDEAYNSYKQARAHYIKLSKEEKAIVYPEIISLHNKIIKSMHPK
jgi:hypothetical protein